MVFERSDSIKVHKRLSDWFSGCDVTNLIDQETLVSMGGQFERQEWMLAGGSDLEFLFFGSNFERLGFWLFLGWPSNGSLKRIEL